MDFQAIYTLALQRADEEEGDLMIDSIVKDGVNEGYRFIASTVDKQLDTHNVASYSSPVNLPSDLLEVVEVRNDDVVLDNIDYVLRNKKFEVRNKDFTGESIDIDYYYTPNAMVDDVDVPVVDVRYHRLLATYGAYKVLLYKKKVEIADRLIAEFDTGIGGEEREL